ncbi:MAG: hypothetical protein QF552_00265 [Litorilituus sp.]|jgi:hypothetical protein|nr:hypothetical protein [Litorilituus sp.]
MDIFTTALTRVVPVPIKPASLKVKALLKEAGSGKLKEDLDHLENHDYYFADTQLEQDHENKQESKREEALTKQVQSKSVDENHATSTNDDLDESKETIKHLDLYV